jgi:PAS domain S-box-containing protein
MTDSNTVAFSSQKYQFLSGGGEMGALMRTKDWSDTPVGTPDHWPQSLRTALSIILHARFPMFLWWGPELTCFYNDAYRPSLGNEGKHPGILGEPAERAWTEIWHIIKPLIDQVLAGGEAPYFEDTLVPIYRNGKIEDVYWTFSYSAVNDESGKPAGVFVTCVETTDKIVNAKQVKHGEEKFKNLINESPIATAVFTGEDFVIELANGEALKLWGKDENIIGKKLIDAMPELDGQAYIDLLTKVYITGETYYGNENFVHIEVAGKIVPTYVNFIYKALRHSDGKIYGILTMGYNVTEQVEARKKIEHNEERLRITAEMAMLDEARLRLATEGTKLSTWELDLTTYEIFHSARLAEIFGHDPSYKMPHRQMRDQMHPEDRHAIVEKAFDVAIENGFYDYVARIIKPDQTLGWIKTQGKVIYGSSGLPLRMIGTLADITENKVAEEKLAMLAAIVQSSEDAIISKTLEGFITSWNDGAEKVFGYAAAEIIGQHVTKLIPQDRFDEEPQILRRIQRGESVEHFETKRITKDNRILDISLTISPIRDTSGKIIGASKIARDVSKQKEAERSIAENQLRLNIAIQAAELGTWEYDVTTGATTYSDRYLEIFGHIASQELSHQSVVDQIHPDDLAMRNQAVKEAIEQTGTMNFDARIIVNQNEIRWIQAKGRLVYDDDNVPIKLMGTIMDITDEKQAAEAIKESEERFRLLSNVMPQFIWTGDPQGNLYYFNQAVYDYSGLTEEQAMNGGWVQIIHPDDKEENIKRWMHSIATGEDFIFEHRFRRQDGEYRWQLSRAVPHRDSNGQIQMWIGTSTDIHDQKISSEKLQKSELLFKTISNTSPVGLWMTDVNGENNFVNDTWIKWTGMPLEQQYIRGWLDRVLEEDKKTIPSFQQAFNRREKYTAEFRITRQDEEIRWCLSEGSPFYDIHGKFAGYAGSVTDITDIKKLEQQKDFFISMASHELKTPITSIKGYVQILMSMHKESPDTFLRNSLATVNKQIGTLTKLITDLLDMSKIKSGNLQLNKEDFSINNMIRETIEEVKHTQPDYTIVFSPESESVVHADRIRIAQVLINFLTNAIKYSPHFNMVTIRSTVINNNVVVSVIDSGIGISKHDQERIFQRFYRVEGKDEKTFPGFGIGLFIAAEIIQRHNGKISVESEPGKGSVFSFSLPL